MVFLFGICYKHFLCTFSLQTKPSFPFFLTVLAVAGLCFASNRAGGSLMGGWSEEAFWDASARISYFFLACMLIYRSNWIIKSKLGFIGLSVLLLFAFLILFSDLNRLIEAIVVLFYFPFIDCFGNWSHTNSRIQNAMCFLWENIISSIYDALCGNVYVLVLLTKYKPETNQLALIIVMGLILLVSIAYLTMVFYDILV